MKQSAKNAPMAAAPLVFNDLGEVMWDEMWTDFCVLAKEGGPPHRGTLLLSKGRENNVNSDNYKYAVNQILRAYKMLTKYKAWDNNGWIAVELKSKNMAKWFANIINLENVECKVEEKKILLPVNDDFTLEKEIKNVVTVLAKAEHYWKHHRSGFTKFIIHIFGKDIQDYYSNE